MLCIGLAEVWRVAVGWATPTGNGVSDHGGQGNQEGGGSEAALSMDCFPASADHCTPVVSARLHVLALTACPPHLSPPARPPPPCSSTA